MLYEYKPYVSASYKLYETKSSFLLAEIVAFDSQSSVATISLGVETPKLFAYKNNHLTSEIYINTNYLAGVVKDVVDVSQYQSLGGVLYWNTPLEPWWASRFFLEFNKVKGSGLDGYNVGIGFTLDI